MLSKDDLDKLREQYPQGIVHLVGACQKWECVFRAPKRAEYKMFRANVHNSARVDMANETIAMQCVVHPSREAFDAMLDTFPAIPEMLAADDEFKNLTGASVDMGSKV